MTGMFHVVLRFDRSGNREETGSKAGASNAILSRSRGDLVGL